MNVHRTCVPIRGSLSVKEIISAQEVEHLNEIQDAMHLTDADIGYMIEAALCGRDPEQEKYV